MTRLDEIQKQIAHVKYLQRCERDSEFADAYDGLIDDLEIMVLNLPDEEEEIEVEPTEEEYMIASLQRRDDEEASRGLY